MLMKPDMHVTYQDHVKHGNVWSVEVTLPMYDADEDNSEYLVVLVDIIAPNRKLAEYITSVMYPDHHSIYTSEQPKFAVL